VARPEKVAAVAEIRDRLTGSDAAVLTEYRGLKVSELAELRGALRPAGTDFKIYKNTLARRAAEEAGFSELVAMLEGPTAIAFVRGDAVIAAKALRDFGKTNAALVVKGGLLGTNILDAGDVTALADVPPRDVLLARLAGGFQAPLAKAASLFGALQRKTAYAFQALIDQRIAAGETLDAPAADTADAPAGQSESPAQAADDSTASAGEAAVETEPTETTDAAPAESVESTDAAADAPAAE
jgi:large subunit ribosomal protein L10